MKTISPLFLFFSFFLLTSLLQNLYFLIFIIIIFSFLGVDIPTLLKLSEENKHVCAPESKREVAGVPVGAIRASLGWPTTEEDVKKLVEKVDQVV